MSIICCAFLQIMVFDFVKNHKTQYNTNLVQRLIMVFDCIIFHNYQQRYFASVLNVYDDTLEINEKNCDISQSKFSIAVLFEFTAVQVHMLS